MIRRLPALLVCIAMAAACSSPTETSYSRAANATYSGIADEPVTLTDGTWRGAPYAEGGASRPVVQLLEQPVSSGDLDDDGVDELVVVLVANFGGSGTYTYIALVDSLDETSQSIGTSLIGDRVQVTSIHIADNIVGAETVEHAADDPMCCPSLNRSREWVPRDGTLVEESRNAAMRVLRGHATIGHEVRSFVECDTAREGWILDMTQGDLAGIYETLAGEQYQPVFIEVNGTWRNPPAAGFGADFDAAVVVDRLVRAEREGFGCLDEPSSYSYRASGNEPSWRLDVQGADISLSRMGGSPIEATALEMQVEDGSRAITTDGMLIRLNENRCVDSMSGSVYAWTAELEIGDDHLTGCAVAGRMPLSEVERKPDGESQ